VVSVNVVIAHNILRVVCIRVYIVLVQIMR